MTRDPAEQRTNPARLAPLLTTAQAAEYLNVSPRQLQRLGVPYVMVGKNIRRYRPETLVAWVIAAERQDAPPAAEPFRLKAPLTSAGRLYTAAFSKAKRRVKPSG